MKNNCPICGRERTYKTATGFKVGKNKPCRSCANSISQGGVGWSPFCIDCGVNKREYHSLCLECHNKRSKKYHKEIYRWSKYGLKEPVEMGQCEICGSKDDLVIDHNHTTDKFRGVLCRHCNAALGLFKENTTTINNAINYLRSFNGT